ncbi:hypothetical protein J14TS2_17500 [Bacillus sp. J14TS2]|uniref:MazG-like family protein n=1 Tax=Bacillus sp. J14TS2 TaxID=2807188 RepID=UPI001B259DF0|nr:MazG-like family protein [Bacillus sp. J14TS2]GIN71275.1 hypothetical protein J14TS2_17500 [Bacillus sp. J14TS2]
MNLDRLTKAVKIWSENKSLHKADPAKQMLKVTEEIGEVAASLARGDRAKLKDDIGDSVVTLIILAQQNDLELVDCLETAYQEIRVRKGKMIDGVFVKDSDL